MSAAEEDDICTGDLVELVVQPAVWGMAIGFEGSLVHVRLVDGSRQVFHEYELRKMAGGEPDNAKQADGRQEEGNVIDFTKERELRANTKTKGRA